MATIDEQTLSSKVCNEKVALFYRTMLRCNIYAQIRSCLKKMFLLMRYRLVRATDRTRNGQKNNMLSRLKTINKPGQETEQGAHWNNR